MLLNSFLTLFLYPDSNDDLGDLQEEKIHQFTRKGTYSNRVPPPRDLAPPGYIRRRSSLLDSLSQSVAKQMRRRFSTVSIQTVEPKNQNKYLALTQIILGILPLSLARLFHLYQNYQPPQSVDFDLDDMIMLDENNSYLGSIRGHCLYGGVPTAHDMSVIDLIMAIYSMLNYVGLVLACCCFGWIV